MNSEIAAIQVDKLVKLWPNGRGVHGVDLRVQSGEVVGFLGPNGAGKTTTIRVLMGFARATRGIATVRGLDCWRSQDKIRSETGYVAGDAGLPGKLRVDQYLTLLARLRGTSTTAHRDLCQRLSLETDLPIHTLSRGNRQKVALVAALAHQPPLLIMDEPTSGLDPLLQQRFWEIIGEARERGQAVLLSSHQLDEVQRACDRVAIIRDGVIIAEGAVAELRARSPRRLVFYTKEQVNPPAELGIRLLGREVDRHEYLVTGPLPKVLGWLGQLGLENVELAPPNLQDLFLAYYESPVARAAQ